MVDAFMPSTAANLQAVYIARRSISHFQFSYHEDVNLGSITIFLSRGGQFGIPNTHFCSYKLITIQNSEEDTTKKFTNQRGP